MPTNEQATSHTRGKQTIIQERGIPGTTDYLRVEYTLPEPYTVKEYTSALDDFETRWKKRGTNDTMIKTPDST